MPNNWYSLFKAIHVTFAVIWVGGGVSIMINAIRAQRTSDPRQIVTVAEQAAFLGEKIFAPAGLVVFLMGIATGNSVADATGGEVFMNTLDLNRPIDVVRRDTGNYYLLGYWPNASGRELHSVDVKVNRRGVKVRARRVRGESS